MRHYIAEVSVTYTYPKTFTYRVSGRNGGRAHDFAWRMMRKEPMCKGKHEVPVTIKIIPCK